MIIIYTITETYNVLSLKFIMQFAVCAKVQICKCENEVQM